ncbi:MAG: NAD(P)/FAD-dependent oxidoreductase [Clostridiaceae bacterium]|nr:NAD(P)/FAD-dependent oxidoreductase [Clostridia bacterium]MDY3869939.1 NAD(P)/FAD-dependent oxidoreductase [Clostridiaceae bacterium]
MKIVVVGGGAAGMMAACTAARRGASVILIERNAQLGVKVNITGKGRCNVTNDSEPETLIKNTLTNGRFLYSAFAAMSAQDTMAFFEKIGVPLKVERGKRVFPVSDRARDVSGALKTQLHRLGVQILQHRVKAIAEKDGVVCGVLLQDGSVLAADRVILATGGRSYPRTGSDGDGYRMARALGHTVTELRPSLVPLLTQETSPAQMEGLALKNVTLTVKKDGKKVFSDFGEMVFTAKGISGPLVLSASAHLDGKKHTYPYQAFIDLKPALDAETLDKRLLRDFAENSNRDFSNALSQLLPAKMIPVAVQMCDIPGNQKVHTITRAQRENLCALLKAFPFTVIAAGGWDEAVVTAGGISVKEIDPKTMGSKLVRGLYFAGEIMDVDAYTGGFNLQIAWSTGYCAGQAAAEGE